jgi:hypothetical protein
MATNQSCEVKTQFGAGKEVLPVVTPLKSQSLPAHVWANTVAGHKAKSPKNKVRHGNLTAAKLN